MKILAFLLYAMEKEVAVSNEVHKSLAIMLFLALSIFANLWSLPLEAYFVFGIFSYSYIFWGEKHAEKFLSYFLNEKLGVDSSLLAFKKSRRTQIFCLLVPVLFYIIIVIPLIFVFLWSVGLRD